MELSEQNVNKQRPVYLELQHIRFPATAVASILHRISGVITLVSIGILIWLLNKSLSSVHDFHQVQNLLNFGLVKFVLWGILTALGYHLLAGIRHLIMDSHFWLELDSGNLSAKVTFVLAIVWSVIAGVWVW